MMSIPLVNIKTYYFHINMCYVLMMLLRNFILLVVMVRTTTEMISDGAVLLKPCGVLEMEVSWVDSPKELEPFFFTDRIISGSTV